MGGGGAGLAGVEEPGVAADEDAGPPDPLSLIGAHDPFEAALAVPARPKPAPTRQSVRSRTIMVENGDLNADDRTRHTGTWTNAPTGASRLRPLQRARGACWRLTPPVAPSRGS